ncbi:iron only hydrogenase large subunit-like protein [Desulfohalotomaculum tongense]|uniref:[Fe-Fe] hydrogenase large subunit C-terminal domain-containing protein n=1 Tax=Desulforadius tongensis TaxID=1216062 RepID=UPI00195F063C|nr:[Fe-Fe] hydrogenase large subunit C-terminal domain-containing protein [Desulforadius tongensis]MBM7855945.1 iron only hydrogenase large subunit-like protein [Desulforadius tongensis]
MNPNEFAHRLLVSLARQIKEGQSMDRDRIVNRIMKDTGIEKDDPQYEFWRKRVKKRLSLLLDEDQGENTLLVQLIEGACNHCRDNQPCVEVCPTGAIGRDEQGKYKIDPQKCVECTWCVDNCITGSIVHRSEFAQVASMIMQRSKYPVYAILAPSFVGQFGDHVTPEIFKGALKAIGFSDVYEVAMAADVITAHEAQFFVERMKSGEKFVITSCCCPAFIKLVEKIRPTVKNLVSPSVSPMIAMGKMLKNSTPNCRVVFIGPCIAKKAEAKRPDLQPAVDCVLTYKETKALLEAAGVPLDGSLGKPKMEDASHDGRIYAHTGGVTEAIVRAVKRIDPRYEIRPVQGNGLKECNQLLKQVEEGTLDANFMEGMGCPGGCVGGPGTIIDSKRGAEMVDRHADQAQVFEALDNEQAKIWNQRYGKHSDLHSQKENMTGHVYSPENGPA